MSYIDEQGIALYLKDALIQLKQLRKAVPNISDSSSKSSLVYSTIIERIDH